MVQNAMNSKQIAEMVGVHCNTVGRCLSTYERKGRKELQAIRRSVTKGSNHTLDAEQEARMGRCLQEKTPEQFRFEFALWTRSAVQKLIEYLCGMRMPIRTVGEYLKRWGFTVQRPLTRGYEPCLQAVQRWLDQNDPTIVGR